MDINITFTMPEDLPTSLAIIIAAVIPASVAMYTWIKNENTKRISEEFKRKEKLYLGLINSMKGFYVQPETNTTDPDLVDEFIRQLNLGWLYCPDNVIKDANAFYDSVGNGSNDEEKEEAFGRVMLSIRKDLIAKKPMEETDLKPSDFKHVKANRGKTSSESKRVTV